jgi:hypothetical protein
LNCLSQPNSARISATQTGFNEITGVDPAAPASDAAAITANGFCTSTNATGESCIASISQNRPITLSYPDSEIYLEWETPGKPVRPNNSYNSDVRRHARVSSSRFLNSTSRAKTA